MREKSSKEIRSINLDINLGSAETEKDPVGQPKICLFGLVIVSEVIILRNRRVSEITLL